MRQSSRKRSHWTDWKRRGWGNNTPIVREGCDSIDWGGLEAWSWAKPRTGAIWIDWDGLQENIDLPENTTACCYNIYSIIIKSSCIVVVCPPGFSGYRVHHRSTANVLGRRFALADRFPLVWAFAQQPQDLKRSSAVTQLSIRTGRSIPAPAGI